MATPSFDASMPTIAATLPTGSHSDAKTLLPASMSMSPTDSHSTLNTEDQPRTYFPPPPTNLTNRRKPYPCNVPTCSRSYVTLRNLQLHHQYHPASFLCRFTPCAGAFVSLIDRTVHEVNYHGKSTLLQCHLCPYKTSARDSMRAHIKRQHPEVDTQVAMSWVVHGENPGGDKGVHQQVVGKARNKALWLVCTLCGMKTEREANMYQHLWRNHRDEKTPRMLLLEKIKNEREERVRKAEVKTNISQMQMSDEFEKDEGKIKVEIGGKEEGIMAM